ncbi:hypothetical protein CFP56_000380 [Quercus suber]|uniref:Uncharacterized protein n=1 Tax=Quercus suber TaxID=58331 RepID=A0AAW0MAY8_QUESU
MRSTVRSKGPVETKVVQSSHDSATKQNNLDSLKPKNRFLFKEQVAFLLSAPRVCHAKGSPGPNCCKKKCVDVRADKLNYGRCGKKCK